MKKKQQQLGSPNLVNTDKKIKTWAMQRLLEKDNSSVLEARPWSRPQCCLLLKNNNNKKFFEVFSSNQLSKL